MRRGQATVEMALGSLVFVTLLMVGIYLSETSYLMLKVNEASNFAVWWGTGMRVQHFSGSTAPGDSATYRPWRDLPLHAQSEAGGRYADFNGVGAPQPNGIVQSLSSGSPIQVSCRHDSAFEKMGVPSSPGPAPGDANWRAVASLVRGYFREDTGGMSCRASSEIAALSIPQHFLDGEWNLRESNWSQAPVAVCGAGRASGGGCPGRTGILLGDWAFEGGYGDRANASLLYGRQAGDNDALYEMTKGVWTADQGSRGHAASQFAQAMSGRPSPYDENSFFISSPGSEDAYFDVTVQGMEFRDTRGVYQDRVRGGCFLGRHDCNSAWTQAGF
jgi:hypothetical protein